MVARARRAPSELMDRSEVPETPGQLVWLDSLELQDSLDHRARADHRDNRVIQARWVTLEHPGLLEVLEISDDLAKKVPSDHPDQVDSVATLEHPGLKVLQDHKDSLDLPDLQVTL